MKVAGSRPAVRAKESPAYRWVLVFRFIRLPAPNRQGTSEDGEVPVTPSPKDLGNHLARGILLRIGEQCAKYVSEHREYQHDAHQREEYGHSVSPGLLSRANPILSARQLRSLPLLCPKRTEHGEKSRKRMT